MEKIQSFRDLKVWIKGIEIVEDIYHITKGFPKDEMYGLTSQMRRAAVSIPSNTAEGFKRLHKKEFKQFLYITLGSAAELETQMVLAGKLGYSVDSVINKTVDKIDHLSRMITSLIKAIRV